jgi:peptidoglycan/xylan/chitin deacetylase (PgdA/CDA1 family)
MFNSGPLKVTNVEMQNLRLGVELQELPHAKDRNQLKTLQVATNSSRTFLSRRGWRVASLCSALAAVSILGIGTQTQRSEAAPMPNGMLSLTFDDGWSSQITNARPEMNLRGLKGTYAVLSQALAENWTTVFSLAQAKQLKLEGNEIASHTVDHADLTTLTDAAMQAEIRNAKSYLAANFGGVVPTFVTPYGKYSTKVLSEIRANHAWHRTVTPGLISTDTFTDQLPSYDIHVGVPVTDVKAIIDSAIAQKKWGILTFHEIVDAGASTGTQLNKADFVAILNYVKSSGIEVVTIDQGAKRLSGQLSDVTPGITIYDDALRNFNDWSWATRNVANEAPVHTGSSSISTQINAYSALRLHTFSPFSVAGLGSLEFWIHGGPTGGQNANVVLRNGPVTVGQQSLLAAVGGPVPANVWTKVVMPFSAMGVAAGATIDELSFEDSTGINQPLAYLDDIRLVPGGVSTATTAAPTTPPTTAPPTTVPGAGTPTTASPSTVAPTIPPTTIPFNPTVAGREVFLFDDAFRNGYQSFSSAVTDPAAKSPVHRGTRSIKFTPANRLSFLTRGPSTEGSRYANLRLWIYSKGSGAQRIDVVSYSDTQVERGRISINSILGGSLPGGVWRELVIPLSALNSATGPIGGFALQDASGTNQAAVWIDDLRLVEQTANVPTTTAVSVTTLPVTTVPVTTIPVTTIPVVTPPSTTVPGPNTTVPVQAGALTLFAPNTAKAGVAFPISVTGAFGGGRVDFMVDGKPVGSVSVDNAGNASTLAAAWVTGTVTVEAVWVNYVAGVPVSKNVSTLITVS